MVDCWHLSHQQFVTKSDQLVQFNISLFMYLLTIYIIDGIITDMEAAGVLADMKQCLLWIVFVVQWQ